MVVVAVHKALRADPWQPRALQTAFDKAWDVAWPQIMQMLKDDYLMDHGPSSAAVDGVELGKRRELDLSTWPPPPPLLGGGLAQPVSWLRCRLLYALFPADRTIWYLRFRPELALLFVLAFVGPFGIKNALWLLLFLWIDRDDEYQVINYVLMLKVVIFVIYGLIPLVAGFFRFYGCVQVDECLRVGPGVSDFEQLSVALLFANYVCGFAAFARYKKLRKRKEEELEYEREIDKVDRQLGKFASRWEREEAEKRFRVQKTGEAIFSALMVADVCYFAALMVLGSLYLVYFVDGASTLGAWLDGHAFIELLTLSAGPKQRLCWYYLSVLAGLGALPFALLKMPGIGLLILRLNPTGYDERANLRLVMSTSKMRDKWKLEEKERGNRPRRTRLSNITSSITSPKFASTPLSYSFRRGRATGSAASAGRSTSSSPAATHDAPGTGRVPEAPGRVAGRSTPQDSVRQSLLPR